MRKTVEASAEAVRFDYWKAVEKGMKAPKKPLYGDQKAYLAKMKAHFKKAKMGLLRARCSERSP